VFGIEFAAMAKEKAAAPAKEEKKLLLKKLLKKWKTKWKTNNSPFKGAKAPFYFKSFI